MHNNTTPFHFFASAPERPPMIPIHPLQAALFGYPAIQQPHVGPFWNYNSQQGRSSALPYLPNPISLLINGPPEEPPAKPKKKRHICQYCFREFTKSYNLIIHVRTHTNERPYPCKECGKAFKRQDHLRDHKYTHMKKKPFECPICFKGFCQARTMMMHRAAHDSQSEDPVTDVPDYIDDEDDSSNHSTEDGDTTRSPSPEENDVEILSIAVKKPYFGIEAPFGAGTHRSPSSWTENRSNEENSRKRGIPKSVSLLSLPTAISERPENSRPTSLPSLDSWTKPPMSLSPEAHRSNSLPLHHHSITEASEPANFHQSYHYTGGVNIVDMMNISGPLVLPSSLYQPQNQPQNLPSSFTYPPQLPNFGKLPQFVAQPPVRPRKSFSIDSILQS